jgi:hypothetical protein
MDSNNQNLPQLENGFVVLNPANKNEAKTYVTIKQAILKHGKLRCIGTVFCFDGNESKL